MYVRTYVRTHVCKRVLDDDGRTIENQNIPRDMITVVK